MTVMLIASARLK